MKDVMAEIPFEDFLAAYKDCRRKKRNTYNALVFEIDYLSNLYQLYCDVNNRVYEVGKSICFVVTRPKPREVFAADFRDRIIHHLVIAKLNSLFEDLFIEDTYNCRKNKGVLYGVRRLAEKIDIISENGTRDTYVAKFDMKGFFMNISRKALLDKLIEFIDNRYKGGDIELIKYLVGKIVNNCPEKNCIRKSPDWKWSLLDEGKSLFTCREGYGLPIGNLSSQVFANFFLSDFDWWMRDKFGIGYGRYVDDFFIVSNDKKKILHSISEIRDRLESIGITLHPNKLYIQHYTKGISFTGAFVKPNRILPGKRLINNVLSFGRKDCNSVERLISSSNSYLGFLRQYKAFDLRKRFVNALYKRYGRYIYSTANLLTIKTRYNYENLNQKITIQAH